MQQQANARKSVWFLVILLIFLLYSGVVVYSHHYRSALINQIADASLKYKTYHRNENPWYKPR